MAKTNDLTQGAIWKTLLKFAMPLLLGSLVQQLYNTVDLIFVGNCIDKSASAAIGASSLLITCLVGFFSGLGVGAGVTVARLFGAKDRERLSKAIHNAIALSISGGLLFMGVGYFLAPFYLRMVNTPNTLWADAIAYLRIYFLSFVSMFCYNLGSGVLRALGDAKAPLYAQLFGGLLNVVMDYLFICLFDKGIIGAARATIISQTAAAVVVLYQLSRLDQEYALKLQRIRFDKSILREMLRIGIPTGAQSFVIALSNVMAQYHINSLGEDAIAAFTAYFKVELVIYLPIVAFGQAVMVFSGQNMGAKDVKRMRKATKIGLLMSASLTVVVSLLALLFGAQLFRIFNKEMSVIRLGCRIIRVTFPFYILYSILQVLGDSLRGAGEVKTPFISILINICIIRTGLLFLLVPMIKQVEGIAVTYPITWFLTAVCMVSYYIKFQRKPEG